MYYIIGGICLIALLYIAIVLFTQHAIKGGSVFLKQFKNTKHFNYDFNDLKHRSKSIYNRQNLNVVFDDNSQIHIFGSIEDKTIIPMVSAITNIDENDIKAGSMHKRIELNEFVKNFEVQSIKNIKIYNKNNELVDYYVSKILLRDGNKQAISISLKNEDWSNIKNISFDSTIEIDASLTYSYCGY
jgi:hypothetical protein